MKSILITGSGGFVGQHLIRLLKKDYFIIGLDRQTPKETFENLTHYEVDITKQDQIDQIISKHKPEVIFHLAAIAQSWIKDSNLLYNVNFLGTLNIFQSVLGVADYHPKIIYVSSAEVYGKTSNPENITEQELLNPINLYAVTKLASDRLAYQYSQSQKLNTVILRPFNHTGPGQTLGFFVTDMASQIAKLEKEASGELLTGNLDAIRDFTDVRDIVNAYKLIIEKDFAPGEVFNICSGKGYKMADILNMLLSKAKRSINSKTDPDRLRPSDIPVFIGDHSKLTQQTGWQPEIPLEQTFEEVLEYYRNIRKV
jgi:GDP-4-dehydro-6-deoxy-D-mannose reductase